MIRHDYYGYDQDYEDPDPPSQPRCPKDGAFMPFRPNAKKMAVVDRDITYGLEETINQWGEPDYEQTIANVIEKTEERDAWQCKRCGRLWEADEVYKS